MTTDKFFELHNWEDILHHNYLTNIHPLSNQSYIATIDNDYDKFTYHHDDIMDYLATIDRPARDRLTLSLAIRSNKPSAIYWYALIVIEGRWLEAEWLILSDANWAFWYITCVVKGRWPEAEVLIRDSVYWDEYVGEYLDQTKRPSNHWRRLV